MCITKIYIASLLVFLLDNVFSSVAETTDEFCVGDVFEPKCSPTEIILMHFAKYGRMQLGKCLHNDLGYLGCNSNVLPQFDEQCSGRKSCQIFVIDKHIEYEGGCMQGLLQYLEASYSCIKSMSLPQQCSTNQDLQVEISSEEVYISSDEIQESCISTGKALALHANEGQTLNVSVINLNNNAIGNDEIYGTVIDPASNQRVVFGGGLRKRHVMASVSNAVKISLQSSSRFVLHLSVSGCPNIAPPEGAWMTRDGDVMEIGCHSGAKSWSLRCEDNQWVGAVGQCGTRRTNADIKTEIQYEDTPKSDISPNVIVFGLGSLVILISAIIFLTGVCILKRKLTPKPRTHIPTLTMGSDCYGNALVQDRPSDPQGRQAIIFTDADYKSLKTTFVEPENGNMRMKTNIDGMTSQPPYPTYMNGGGSDASDSVKYYVVEDGNNM